MRGRCGTAGSGRTSFCSQIGRRQAVGVETGDVMGDGVGAFGLAFGFFGLLFALVGIALG